MGGLCGMWPGTPAPFAGGLSLATKAQACSRQARSAKVRVPEPMTCGSGWTYGASFLLLSWDNFGPHSTLSPRAPQGSRASLAHECAHVLVCPPSFLCLTSPLLLRSPRDNPLAHKALSQSHSWGTQPGRGSTKSI